MLKMRYNIFVEILLIVSFYTTYACDNSSNSKSGKQFENQQNSSLEEGIDTIITSDYLVYFQKNKEYFDCMKKVLPNGTESLIARFTVMPLDVVWDTEKQEVYFITQNGIFKKNYVNSTSLECISDSLPKKESESLGEAWIDEKTGNIRISYGIIAYENDPIFDKRFERLSGDTNEYIPDWGLDMIACISEVNSNGKWKLIKEKASKGAACDTPELEVLRNDIRRKKNTTSNQFEMLRSSYYGKVILDEMKDNRELDSLQIKKIFKNKIPFKSIDEGDPYEVHRVILSKEKTLLVPVYWSGSPYFSSPVFVYDDEKKLKNELKELKQYDNKDVHPYIGISIIDNYLLITNPYEEKEPLIYSLETFKLVGNYHKATEIFILDDNK